MGKLAIFSNPPLNRVLLNSFLFFLPTDLNNDGPQFDR